MSSYKSTRINKEESLSPDDAKRILDLMTHWPLNKIAYYLGKDRNSLIKWLVENAEVENLYKYIYEHETKRMWVPALGIRG